MTIEINLKSENNPSNNIVCKVFGCKWSHKAGKTVYCSRCGNQYKYF